LRILLGKFHREEIMKTNGRSFLLAAAAIVACALLAGAPASAQGVKIGILNDQSGGMRVRIRGRDLKSRSCLLALTTAHGSKLHRHEETIHTRLPPASPAVYARRSILIPIENPILAVLARQRAGDRDRTTIPVDAIVVGVPVDLAGR
jgi:hypothetical protein